MEHIKIIYFLCILLILSRYCVANDKPHLINHVTTDQDVASSNSTKMSAISILKFLKTQSEKFRFGTQKDFSLILGNTNSGKTTLGLLLTAEGELSAYEAVAGSGMYLLVDKKNRISNDSTITSKTAIPELMVDNNGASYYDCTGFSDSRGIEYDIFSSYIIQKLLNSANSVKLVLTINYASVQNGIGDYEDFRTLITHVTTLINDIDKYRTALLWW